MRQTRKLYAPVPPPLLYGAAAAALWGLFTPNPLLTAAGVLLIPLLFRLLWRPGEPPVLLFGAGMQWLSVYLPVINANISGQSVDEFYYLPTIGVAAWLGLVTIIVLAFGMRVGVGPWGLIDSRRLDAWAAQLDASRLLLAYLVALGLAFIIPGIAAQAGGARQLLLPLAELRWILGFMILWGAVRGAIPRLWAVSLVLLEITLGFGSYFSGFKLIVYLAVLAMLAGGGFRVRLFRPAVIGVFVLVLSLGLFWQSIKVEYRSFLNQGTGMQVVLVSPVERAGFILQKAMDFEAEDLLYGFETLFDRLGYLEYFARSIGQVPDITPHQQGRLLIEVFQHIFLPRLFFPDKPAINASERTNEFTGIVVAGAEQGTAISIGYAGESYIDFGPFFMFAPIFLYGFFWGWGYRFLVRRSRFTLLSVCTAVVFLMPAVLHFEASNLIIIGGGVTSLLVLTILLSLFGPMLWRYLTAGRGIVIPGDRGLTGVMPTTTNPAPVPSRSHAKQVRW